MLVNLRGNLQIIIAGTRLLRRLYLRTVKFTALDSIISFTIIENSVIEIYALQRMSFQQKGRLHAFLYHVLHCQNPYLRTSEATCYLPVFTEHEK